MSILSILLQREDEKRRRHLRKLEQVIGKVAYWQGITSTGTIKGIKNNLPIQEDHLLYDISSFLWERNN